MATLVMFRILLLTIRVFLVLIGHARTKRLECGSKKVSKLSSSEHQKAFCLMLRELPQS